MLMSFGNAGKQTLLPVARAMLDVSPYLYLVAFNKKVR